MGLTHELAQKHKTLDKGASTFVQGFSFAKSVNLSENLGISRVWGAHACVRKGHDGDHP